MLSWFYQIKFVKMRAKFIFVKSEQGNMTGMKENQSTKGTLRRRRTNKQVQADILSAVGRILQEKDFYPYHIDGIAREAKTDPMSCCGVRIFGTGFRLLHPHD